MPTGFEYKGYGPFIPKQCKANGSHHFVQSRPKFNLELPHVSRSEFETIGSLRLTVFDRFPLQEQCKANGSHHFVQARPKFNLELPHVSRSEFETIGSLRLTVFDRLPLQEQCRANGSHHFVQARPKFNFELPTCHVLNSKRSVPFPTVFDRFPLTPDRPPDTSRGFPPEPCPDGLPDATPLAAPWPGPCQPQ